MLLKNLEKLIVGYINVKVEGYFIEKYINLCQMMGVKLEDILIENSSTFRTKVIANDFKKIRKIARKTKCKVHIIDKKGIPFLLHKYRKRKALGLIGVVILGGIIILNSMLFTIKINIDDIEIKDKVDKSLKGLGVHKYCNKYNIDKKYIRNIVMLEVQELSWLDFEVDGVVLNVDAKLRKTPPEIIDENECCNIISKRRGMITKVVTKTGRKMVNEGDLVEEGDILISGVLDSEKIQTYYVHADGEVYAKVWYTKEIELPFEETIKIYTNEQKNIYGINILNKKVFFGKLSTNYKEYDTMLNEMNMNICGIKLPIKIYKYVLIEINTNRYIRTYEQLLENGKNILEQRTKEDMTNDSTIVEDMRYNVMEFEDRIKIELICECTEQIGTKETVY